MVVKVASPIPLKKRVEVDLEEKSWGEVALDDMGVLMGNLNTLNLECEVTDKKWLRSLLYLKSAHIQQKFYARS